MAKRTRRDLSNPRIKKIIKAQTGDDGSAAHQFPTRDAAPPRWRLFLSLALVLILIASGMFIYLNWADFRELLSFSGSSSRNSSVEQTRSPDSDPVDAARPATHDGATVAQDSATVPAPQTMARRIQVEVLNGCGVDGLAEQITNYLREKNIDVVSRGNYSHFDVPLTTVLDRVDNRERSLQIVKVLGLPEKQLQLQKDANLQLDATIVLGADYKQLTPFK